MQAGAFQSGKSEEDKMDEFDEMGLSMVHFQEYNREYPHRQWTVGFANSGPDFYINMQDNTEEHGPRSQVGELFDDNVDPCFGEIVEGRNTIEMICSLPAAHIVKARIMGLASAPRARKQKHWLDKF